MRNNVILVQTKHISIELRSRTMPVDMHMIVNGLQWPIDAIRAFRRAQKRRFYFVPSKWTKFYIQLASEKPKSEMTMNLILRPFHRISPLSLGSTLRPPLQPAMMTKIGDVSPITSSLLILVDNSVIATIAVADGGLAVLPQKIPQLIMGSWYKVWKKAATTTFHGVNDFFQVSNLW